MFDQLLYTDGGRHDNHRTRAPIVGDRGTPASYAFRSGIDAPMDVKVG